MFIYSIYGWSFSDTPQARDRVASQYCQKCDRFSTNGIVSSGRQNMAEMFGAISDHFWDALARDQTINLPPSAHCLKPQKNIKTHLLKKMLNWEIIIMLAKTRLLAFTTVEQTGIDEYTASIFHNWFQMKLGINVFSAKLKQSCISSKIKTPVSVINARTTYYIILFVLVQCFYSNNTIHYYGRAVWNSWGATHISRLSVLSVEVGFCGNLGKESKETGASWMCLCKPACLADLLMISQKASVSQ